MKKILITHPITTYDEYVKEHDKICSYLNEVMTEEYMVLPDKYIINAGKNFNEFLSYCLSLIPEADCVVFGDNWDKSKVCRFINQAAYTFEKNTAYVPSGYAPKIEEPEPICILRDDKGKITSDYGYTSYDKLSELLQSGNYQNYIKDGDYIELTLKNGYTFKMIANIDTYCYNNNIKDIIHHIDFISENLIPGSKGWQMRDDFHNSGALCEPSPFLNSNLMIDNLDNYYKLLPNSIKAHIIKKRVMIPNRLKYTNPNIRYDNDTYSRRRDLPYLWIPYITEIVGDGSRFSNTYEAALNQYPCFKNGKNLKKEDILITEESKLCDWWTASAINGSTVGFYIMGFNLRDNEQTADGYVYQSPSNSDNNGVPLCFRFV